ncbi:unnamed protein product [Closterium sp. NIES-54]
MVGISRCSSSDLHGHFEVLFAAGAIGVVEPAISLVLEAGEDFKAVTDAVQANPTVVLLDYGYSHHLMGTEEAFVKMQPSDDVRHVRGFNEALQSIRAEAPSLCKGRSGSRPCRWTRTPSTPPTDSSSVHPPLLVADDKLDEDDANNVTPSLPPPVQWSSSATGDEERLGTSPAAPTSCIAGVQRDTEKVSDGKRQTTGESSTLKKTAETPSAEAPTVEKLSAEAPTSREPSAEELLTREQLDDDSSSNVVEVVGASGGDEGETLIGEQSDNSDVVEVAVKEAKLRYTLLDDAEDDIDLPELDPDMHANPEHRWDIANMTVKEALASWKGKAVKAAMDEGTRSLISNGTWELVERPRRVNIMKNRWVLMMKYHVDDTVAREKDRLIVKGFMQLDMKKAFMQSKLDRVLYMYQPDYYNDGTGRVCKLLKSLYGLKQTLLLWYKALNDELSGADWKKSQVDEALNFKVGDDGVAGWVLMYVDDLLAASSSTAMLKELKVLLEVAFELCEISPVEKYLVLEIVRDRSARNLWLPQQVYVDNLRRRFINEEQTGRVPKTPISVDAYAELKFDNEEF